MVIDIFFFPHPHTAENIATRVYETLNDWEIEDKIFCVTSDRGPNFVKAGKYLTGTISDECPIIKQKINFHHFCGAHIINNLVETFLLKVQETKYDEPYSQLIIKIRYYIEI